MDCAHEWERVVDGLYTRVERCRICCSRADYSFDVDEGKWFRSGARPSDTDAARAHVKPPDPPSPLGPGRGRKAGTPQPEKRPAGSRNDHFFKQHGRPADAVPAQPDVAQEFRCIACEALWKIYKGEPRRSCPRCGLSGSVLRKDERGMWQTYRPT